MVYGGSGGQKQLGTLVSFFTANYSEMDREAIEPKDFCS